MIQVVLIFGGLTLILFAFGVFGSLPPTPDWLTSFSSTLAEWLVHITYIFAWLLTPTIFFGSIVIFFAIIAWEPIYYSVMWVLKKIPVLGIN